MTTHLEEATEIFDLKYKEVWNSKISAFVPIPQGIKSNMIKDIVLFHIAYLEKSILRLEKMKRTERISHTPNCQRNPTEDNHQYCELWIGDEEYNDAIEEEISHKQQELLQAKELLK